jgi:hypothetical protein
MGLMEYLRQSNPLDLTDEDLINEANDEELEPFALSNNITIEELRERMLMHLGGRENFDDPPFVPNPYQLAFEFLELR